MSIYIVTHKGFSNYTKDYLYKPLLVGAYKNVGPNSYLKDNSDTDNISEKNQTFCELTGQYWIWKHSDDDIVGLCHYRRYFTKNSKVLSKTLTLSSSDIKGYLQNYDVILPTKRKFSKDGLTAKEFFNKFHDEDVWDKCKTIIQQRYPEYSQSFDWFENETEAYCYNMLISKKSLFDNYSEWLFDILFELEQEVDLSKYDDYNKRMIGFVAERLINIWIHQNRLSVKEMPVVFTESNSRIKHFFKNL